MSDWQLKTPVVFIIFNRPDTTERVFTEIAKAKPPKLLVVADGPRANHLGEAEKCAATRAIIDRVNWDCEVLTNYSDVNLGCRNRPASGLDWVFEQVEEAIILEDDCVPDPDFFRYCETMLMHYRNDTRIMMICGTNYLQSLPDLTESYFFTNYYPVWGWATWRRAWKHYDIDINAWDILKKKRQLQWLFGNKKIPIYYENMFALIENGFDAWDIQWWFACIFQHGLAIVPRDNLVSNIGASGTHTDTQGELHLNMPTYPFDINIKHPLFITPDAVLSKLTYEHSHAKLDLSLKTAINRGSYKRIIMAVLPVDLVHFLQKLAMYIHK